MSDLFMTREAVISECGRYRYLLRREWEPTKPRALYVMLNPSTADAAVDDATIRSCIRLCRHAGYGGFEVVNLFAFRATNPLDMADAEDPVGPRNNSIAQAAIGRCDTIICAWGAHWMADEIVSRNMIEMIIVRRPAAFCYGKTKHGAPKHPLYIKTGTPLEVFR